MEQTHHHDNGALKPKVALIPVIDSSSHELPWSLSDEFSDLIYLKLFETGNFYFTSDFEQVGKNPFISKEMNPFAEDLQWLLEMSSPTEFMIFVELFKHRLTEKEKSLLHVTQNYTLDISFRVKVVDIRVSPPRVVLQELFEDSFQIAWKLDSVDYKNRGWSKTAFFLSPIGIAHMQMCKQMTKQIEDYILLSQANL